MNFKDLFNKLLYVNQGTDTYNYEKNRIQDLLQKGYTQEQVNDIVQKEVFTRYGLSAAGKAATNNVCMDAGIYAGGIVGTAAPGIGNMAGAVAGGAAMKYGCSKAIDYLTDHGIKKISEKIVSPANADKKIDLRNREMYFESLNPHIEKQSPKYFWERPNASKYQGYKNPLTNDNRIYTREDIKSFNTQEYNDAEPEIMAQWKTIGIPTNGELENERSNNSGMVHVSAYTRNDGTKVKAYYRAS